MNFYKLKLVLGATLLALPPTLSLGADLCNAPKLLGAEAQTSTIDQLVDMEDQINDLLLAAQNSGLEAEVLSLKERFDHESQSLIDSQDLSQARVFQKIKRDFLALEDRVHLLATTAPTSVALLSPWEQIRQGHQMIVAEQAYEVQTTRGDTIWIHFNQQVLDAIFYAKDFTRQRASKKFFKALEKGFVAQGSKESGIVPLVDNNDVLEVRIIGSQMAFRLGGYVKNNHFFIVYATNRSDHSSRNYLIQFLSHVRGARQNRAAAK